MKNNQKFYFAFDKKIDSKEWILKMNCFQDAQHVTSGLAQAGQ